MKAPPERTKVVIRHLPPSLSQSDLLQQIDDHFSGRFNWFSFCPGKNSYKHQKYSRAYINFNCAEDVVEFAQFFDGHVFVNEKGAQHKAIVEYSPFQRVPKSSTKKDGREGTIYKDPDYLEFLKLIAKPPEHLPSAEIQLERKEAEQAGLAKEAPIVTPLMEYIRQKRAVESGVQASPIVTKINRRARVSSGKPGSENTRRGSEKKKYVQKDNVKSSNRKGKSSSIVAPGREDQPSASSSKDFPAVHGIEGPISAIPLPAGSGKKKILLVKGKEREILRAAENMPQQQNVQPGNPAVSTGSKQNQRREASGRLIRSLILNNEARQSQSTTSAQQKQILSSENGKRPSRNTGSRYGTNGQVFNHDSGQVNSEGDSKRTLNEKFVKRDLHGLGGGEKTERRTRNKDRPDRGVWAPLRRSDVSHTINEHLSSSGSQSTLPRSEAIEVSAGEMKDDVFSGSRKGEYTASSGRNSSSIENGSQKHFTRRGAAYAVKEDAAVNISEAKPSKKGITGPGAHEKQMWVQKSSSGS